MVGPNHRLYPTNTVMLTSMHKLTLLMNKDIFIPFSHSFQGITRVPTERNSIYSSYVKSDDFFKTNIQVILQIVQASIMCGHGTTNGEADGTCTSHPTLQDMIWSHICYINFVFVSNILTFNLSNMKNACVISKLSGAYTWSIANKGMEAEGRGGNGGRIGRKARRMKLSFTIKHSVADS
jgi:hypothetical protein